MASSPDATKTASGAFASTWNARLHYYLGLYFLFFIWLFAVTGLLLNHGAWGMADMQRSRTAEKSEHQIMLPKAGTPLDDAREIMRQLQIEGEVQWLATTGDAARFDFRVTRPGTQIEVRTDLGQSIAVVERTRVSSLGALRALHEFTGVRLNDPKNDRDWIVTKLWAFSMDAVAAGLLVMVGSGLVMAWERREKWLASAIALGLGLAACGLLLFGVRGW